MIAKFSVTKTADGNRFVHLEVFGMHFSMFKSSNGRINVQMTSGPQDFIGYVDSVVDGLELIAGRFASREFRCGMEDSHYQIDGPGTARQEYRDGQLSFWEAAKIDDAPVCR